MEKNIKVISEEHIRNVIREELKSFLLNEKIDNSAIKNIVLFAVLAMLPSYRVTAGATQQVDATPSKTLEDVLKDAGLTTKLANELSAKNIEFNKEDFEKFYNLQQRMIPLSQEIKQLESTRQKLIDGLESGQAKNIQQVTKAIQDLTNQIEQKNKSMNTIMYSGGDEFTKKIIDTSRVAINTISNFNKQGIEITPENVQQKGIEYLLSPEGRVEIANSTVDDDLRLVQQKIESTYGAKFVGASGARLPPLEIVGGFVASDNQEVSKLTKIETLDYLYDNPELLNKIGLSQDNLQTFQFFIPDGETLKQINNYYQTSDDNILTSDELSNAEDTINLAIKKQSELKENVNKLRKRLNEIRGLYV